MRPLIFLDISWFLSVLYSRLLSRSSHILFVLCSYKLDSLHPKQLRLKAKPLKKMTDNLLLGKTKSGPDKQSGDSILSFPAESRSIGKSFPDEWLENLVVSMLHQENGYGNALISRNVD